MTRLLGTIAAEGFTSAVQEDEDGRVICAGPWARSIVILGPDNQPRVFPGGGIASMTWYRHPGRAADDPAAHVDSETVPYIVVPPLVVQRTTGIVRGCKARASFDGRSVDCVVADRGPIKKSGRTEHCRRPGVGHPAQRHCHSRGAVRAVARHCRARLCAAAGLTRIIAA